MHRNLHTYSHWQALCAYFGDFEFEGVDEGVDEGHEGEVFLS